MTKKLFIIHTDAIWKVYEKKYIKLKMPKSQKGILCPIKESVRNPEQALKPF